MTLSVTCCSVIEGGQVTYCSIVPNNRTLGLDMTKQDPWALVLFLVEFRDFVDGFLSEEQVLQ